MPVTRSRTLPVATTCSTPSEPSPVRKVTRRPTTAPTASRIFRCVRASGPPAPGAPPADFRAFSRALVFIFTQWPSATSFIASRPGGMSSGEGTGKPIALPRAAGSVR